MEKIDSFDSGAIRSSDEGRGVPTALPLHGLHRVSLRAEEGMRKYGRDNWKKGIPLSRFMDSAFRHWQAYVMGDCSEDHLAALAWNALAAMDTEHFIVEDEDLDYLDDLGTLTKQLELLHGQGTETQQGTETANSPAESGGEHTHINSQTDGDQLPISEENSGESRQDIGNGKGADTSPFTIEVGAFGSSLPPLGP